MEIYDLLKQLVSDYSIINGNDIDVIELKITDEQKEDNHQYSKCELLLNNDPYYRSSFAYRINDESDKKAQIDLAWSVILKMMCFDALFYKPLIREKVNSDLIALCHPLAVPKSSH